MARLSLAKLELSMTTIIEGTQLETEVMGEGNHPASELADLTKAGEQKKELYEIGAGRRRGRFR